MDLQAGAGGAEPFARPTPRRPPRRGWRRALARLEALLALCAVGAAVALITTSTLNPPSSGPPPKPQTIKISLHHVRPGDTLAKIAVRYHTTVAILEGLNPRLDPRALRPGQPLRVGTLS